MLVKVNLSYTGEIFDAEYDQVVRKPILLPVWVDHKDLPDPPTGKQTMAGTAYKKNITFFRDERGVAEVAVGAWTGGEPGVLVIDKVIPMDAYRKPARRKK